jgi:hypothetical protein
MPGSPACGCPVAMSDFLVDTVLLDSLKRRQTGVKILPPKLRIDVEGYDSLDLGYPSFKIHKLAPSIVRVAAEPA